jgi:hypothetical protein
VEVARRIWQEHIDPVLVTLAAAVGDAFEEWAFRLSLAFDVLVGRMPQRIDKRPWVRSIETPVLADVRDWTDDRLLFSVLIWPPLEADGRGVHHQRVENVMDAIARGATEKAWSTYWEVDYGLVWNHEREVWVDGDGHAYDGSRFGAGSRRPHAA